MQASSQHSFTSENAEPLDVLIVGAGLSGIGAARHLQMHCPQTRWRILESREAIGGTWDLFRYPGIRSDSDMYTLGYAFKPWIDSKSIADGRTIRNYIQETADENGITQHIRYGHAVTHATWSSTDACWTVTATQRGAPGSSLGGAATTLCTVAPVNSRAPWAWARAR